MGKIDIKSRYRARRRVISSKAGRFAPSASPTAAPPSLFAVSVSLPPIQIFPHLSIPTASQQSAAMSPTIEVRQPNTEDKMIADMVRLGLAVVRKYPNECAAFVLGVSLAALIDAARNS
jgi:hypothetical protein